MQECRTRKWTRGSSMIETFTVFVLLSILAVAAVPIYGKYARESRTGEAVARLGEIVTSARAFAMHNLDEAGKPKWPPRSGGGLVDLSPSRNFTYAIVAGAGGDADTTFLRILAKGREGTGMAGVKIEMLIPGVEKGGLPPMISGL